MNRTREILYVAAACFALALAWALRAAIVLAAGPRGGLPQ